MTPLIETIPAWFGVGAGGGAGFLLAKWFVEYIGGRMDRRADALDKGTQSLIENLQAQLKALTEREAAREQRISVIEEQLAECNRKHAESEAEVMRLKAMMQGYGDAREKVQLMEAAKVVPARRRAAK